MTVMKHRNQPPNFRRTRGPFYKEQPVEEPKPLAFGWIVLALFAATFGAIFFSDQLMNAARHPVQFMRSFERENTPQPGAYYSGCNDARAAGVAPLYSDEPGYRPDMDGDGDGIACEPYRGM